MLRELLRRVDMMVILENKLDALVRLHTPWPPGLIGHAYQYDIASNLRPESLSGPNAGLTEVLIPAGYVTTVYDPVYKLTPDGKRYVSQASDKPTTIPAPGLPFSLVFRAEPGKEDVLLKVASAYEAASTAARAAAEFRAVVVSWITRSRHAACGSVTPCIDGPRAVSQCARRRKHP